ncbi:MAG: DinB family protein [bacterium]
MRIIDSIIMEFDQEAVSTEKLLSRVPSEKLGWKPHEKSMSLGELAYHIATTPAFMAKMAAPDTFDFATDGPKDRTPPGSTAEILKAFHESIAAAKDQMQQYDDGRVMSNWTMLLAGKTIMTIPRIVIFRSFLLNHLYHHRGQLTVYLRMNGVSLPAIYGPSADDNPFM